VIDSIEVVDVATFRGCHSLKDLRDFNYVYGGNTVGKTTISRVIADESAFPKCKVSWRNGDKLQALVYNRDFVDTNFSHTGELKGIFTLGEQNVELVKKIAKAKQEHEDLSRKMTAIRNQLQGENGDGGEKRKLAILDDTLSDQCWDVKKQHDKDFKSVFGGTNHNKDKFRERALTEFASNKTPPIPLDELRQKAATLFGEVKMAIPLLPSIDVGPLISAEANPILAKKIVGKGDVDIAAMIEKLGNSDWVKQGLAFYESSRGQCPFCQQPTPAHLKKNLEEYFDESFEADITAIRSLVHAYDSAWSVLKASLHVITNLKSAYLNLELFESDRQALDAVVTTNLTRLRQKEKEPSGAIGLESIIDVSRRLLRQLGEANTAIKERNATVANCESEKRKLAAGVWRLLLDGPLKPIIETYTGRQAEIKKAIASLSRELETTTVLLRNKNAELQALEKSVTSIKPTAAAINALLKSFCFTSFTLEVTSDLTYRMVRSNGDAAEGTLSESEKTFISFLYFFHLLKGSPSATGVLTDRIVVFDDPISSLDSDVLHIVSSLIKGLIEDVREKNGRVKQIFVLTHNVHFHKEVTYNPKRRDVALREETFWMVRKHSDSSYVEAFSQNPIKTTYELLWADVRRSAHTKHSIQNTLRRVLESSFSFLGKSKLEKLHDHFTGRDREVCRCLLSWIHDGSHMAHDDLFVAVDDRVIEIFLQVFRSIFDKAGFIDHYNMMMGIVAEPESPPPVTLPMAEAAKAG
jgi:wobble nucleotide-excising tRNase